MERRYYQVFDKTGLTVMGVFIAAVVVILNFVIPPFQCPDEPNHFGAILIHSFGEENRPAVEKGVIRMMERNNWWRFVGMSRPQVLPERLSDIDYLMDFYPATDFRMRLNNIEVYHFMVGKALKIFPYLSVETAYYVCRLVSSLLFIGALILTGISMTIISKRGGGVFQTGFLLILFLPQFLLEMVSVNSDALAVLLGAIFFHCVVLLFMGDLRARNFLGLLAAAVLGFLSDRSTFALVPLGLMVPFFLFRRKRYQSQVVYVLAFFMVFFVLTAVLINLFPLQADNSLQIFSRNLARVGEAVPRLLSFGEASRGFVSYAMDGFLFKLGWSAFSAAGGVYLIWRILVTLSVAGTVVFIIKVARARIEWGAVRSAPAFQLKLAGFFIPAVLLDLFAAWTYYGFNNILAQGRHFFPLILPITFLFVLGIRSLFNMIHREAGKIAVAVLVFLEFIFLNSCVWQYMIPVFHLTIKSPFAGM